MDILTQSPFDTYPEFVGWVQSRCLERQELSHQRRAEEEQLIGFQMQGKLAANLRSPKARKFEGMFSSIITCVNQFLRCAPLHPARCFPPARSCDLRTSSLQECWIPCVDRYCTRPHSGDDGISGCNFNRHD